MKIAEVVFQVIATAFVTLLMAGIVINAINKRTVEVEHFTTDMTIRIQCSGDCDLAAMIAEAREAVEK